MLVLLPVLVCLAAIFIALLPPHELQFDKLTGDTRSAALPPARLLSHKAALADSAGLAVPAARNRADALAVSLAQRVL